MNSTVQHEMGLLQKVHAELTSRESSAKVDRKPYFDTIEHGQLIRLVVDARAGIFDYPHAIQTAEDIAVRGQKMGIKFRIIVHNSVHCTVTELGGSHCLRSAAEIVNGMGSLVGSASGIAHKPDD